MTLVLSLLAAAGIYLLVLWDAFALQTLWGWFVVKQFSLPPLGMAHAIGISILVGLLTHQAPHQDRETSQVVAHGIAGPAMALLVGWIAKQFL